MEVCKFLVLSQCTHWYMFKSNGLGETNVSSKTLFWIKYFQSSRVDKKSQDSICCGHVVLLHGKSVKYDARTSNKNLDSSLLLMSALCQVMFCSSCVLCHTSLIFKNFDLFQHQPSWIRFHRVCLVSVSRGALFSRTMIFVEDLYSVW